MKLLQNKLFLFIINILLIQIIYTLRADNSLSNYIDSYFLLSSIYLLLALLLFIVKERFFDGITFGFKRFYHLLSKNKDYLDEWQEKPLPSERVNKSFLQAISFQGILLFLIMAVLLIFYYIIN